MKAIDPGAEIRYVLKDDRDLPPEEQTVFLLKPLTAKEAAKIQDNLTEATTNVKTEKSTMRFFTGSQVLMALMLGLRGWENFKLPNGEDAPWRENNGNPRPENLDYIRRDDRKELAEVIIEGGEVSEEETKK